MFAATGGAVEATIKPLTLNPRDDVQQVYRQTLELRMTVKSVHVRPEGEVCERVSTILEYKGWTCESLTVPAMDIILLIDSFIFLRHLFSLHSLGGR